VVSRLLEGLQEDVGSVGGLLVLTLLGDGPSLGVVVGDLTVVSGDGLQFDLDVSLHGPADRVDLFASVVSIDVDLVLDVLDTLFSADPGWSCSEMWEVLGVNIILLTLSEDVELITVWNRWGLRVDKFVKMVVNDLAQVDNRSFLELDLTLLVELHPGSVNESHISDIELSVDGANHELCLPELFVVRNMVMSRFSFTNLVDGSVTLDSDLNVSEFFSIYLLEFEHQSLVGDAQSLQVDNLSLKIASLNWANFSQSDGSES